MQQETRENFCGTASANPSADTLNISILQRVLNFGPCAIADCLTADKLIRRGHFTTITSEVKENATYNLRMVRLLRIGPYIDAAVKRVARNA